MPLNFTTLPPEVSNQIYSHVFDYDFVTPYVGNIRKRLLFNPPPERNDGFYEKSDPQQILALLSVNRQISDEAATCFYGKTNIRGCWHEVAAFVKGIGVPRNEEAWKSRTQLG